MESQNKMIEEHLKSGKSLTPMEAFYSFQCLRLSGRILELRRQGMNIITEMVEHNNKRFARYVLETK